MYIGVFDIKIALEITKVEIPEGLQFQIFFAISQTWWGQVKNFPQKFILVFYKS